ncbi:MAG: asparagine synthase (glutamine-hydrolyzing) [Chloroflexota bacterium]|nr:asparagine synthase (glutamine-hydrolyzing) [Chloroflexota bacterium]
MCGICGIYNSGDTKMVQRMCRAMVHRGPDDEGIAGDGKVVLGARRLAILDLSPAGHQPMQSADGRVRLAYNGEVYNYRELNAELAAQGFVAHSHCDTETILHAYEHEGIACLQRLRGMFAIALWDAAKGQLFLARDRLGIKPLYYAQVGDKVLFGSELKVLLASGLVARALDPVAVDLYLTFGVVPAPYTMFKGIRALLPGHYATVDAAGIRLTRYWNVAFAAGYPQRSEDEWAEELRARLTEAVRLRLVSDVPLGAFLSGGVDSGAIVGLMSSMTDRPVDTYSIDFDRGGAAYNETAKAQQVADRFGAHHHPLRVTGADLARELPRIIPAMDQPTHDGINTYFVSQHAKSGVTVALSGLGADELFGGYSTFRFAARLAQYRGIQARVPVGVGRAAAGVLERLPPRYGLSWALRGAAGMLNAYPTAAEQYLLVRGFFSPAGQATLRNGHGGAEAAQPLLRELLAELPPTDVVNQISYLELKTYMADQLLRDTDVMSMAFSLEARVPFLDHPLVEFVATMPPDLKMRPGQPKYILKKAVADLLPAGILHAPKMGFGFPLAYWMREQPLRGIVSDCLSRASVERRGLLAYPAVAAAERAFYSGDRTDPRSYQLYERVWLLTVLELWCRSYLDG